MTDQADNIHEHHRQVEEIFNRVVDQSDDDTQRMLDELCGNNTTLRSDVERLLSVGDDGLGAFMDASRWSLSDTSYFAGYRIIKQIGEGGMGSVFLAEQENPRRQVALKSLKSRFASTELRKRFEYEAQTLGQLKHPGIAQIYEAGSANLRNPAGLEFKQPFFAMELVDGCTLTEYASNQELSIADKLRLVVDVCLAVQSAHHHGVVHRDLKPANILVTEKGQIKILDFGVARLTDDNEQGHGAVSTQTGQLMGTLAYMSPEQVSGDSDQVDTRSDVYSIGVLLYELLSGHHPYDVSQLSIPDAVQTIQQKTPDRISKYDSKLRGDIETIVQKSLEKDKDRRYQSASDLAADVNRYLNHLPIEARPVSTIYQLQKFARRHTGLVAAIGFILIMLISAGVLISMFAYNQAIALKDAKRQILITNEVNNFLNDDLLSKANPNVSLQKDVTVRTLLDAAAENIGNRFAGMPQVEAAVRFTIGSSYFGIGAFEAAEMHLAKSRLLYLDELGADDERTLEVSDKLANTYLKQWKLDLAEELCQENLVKTELGLGDSHPRTARVHATYAILLKRRGKFAEAESHYRLAIELWDRYDLADLRSRTMILNNLALVLRDQEKFDEAETVLRDVVKQWKSLVGRNHPDTAFGITNLGDVLWYQSKRKDVEDESWKKAKFDEAAELFGEAVDIQMEVLGEQHPETARSLYAVALIHKGRGEYEQAEQLQLRVLELRRQIYGTDENIDVLDSLNSIGTVRNAMGKHELAATMFQSAVVTALGMVGPDHYRTKMYLGNLLYTYRVYLKDDAAIQSLFEEYGDQLSESGQKRVLKELKQTLENNSKHAEAIHVQQRLDELIKKNPDVNGPQPEAPNRS